MEQRFSENDLSIVRDVEEILVAQSVSDAAIKRVSSFMDLMKMI